MLTKSLLRQLATDTSYDRGEAYFRDGSVRRISRTGNTFSGKVDGSERYQVSLDLSASMPDFECSCPYNFEGICKHSVAFGLAVLQEFGPAVELIETTRVPDVSAVDLNTLWQQTTTEQKLTFLQQLLDKQPELRVQLAQFSGQATLSGIVFLSPDANIDDTESIDSISTTVFELLSELAFDDDGLEMDEDDYYSEESPDPTPLIESVLTDYADQVTKALRESRLTDAMTVCLGVYEGSQTATEPEADEYDIISNYPAEVWAVWNDLLTDAYTQLARQVLHPDQIDLALNQLADRVTLFDEADDNPHELYYDLKPFELLLLALVTDEPSARAMQQAIQQHDWPKRGTEYVQLHIADVLDNPGLWYQTADPFADHDPVIAQWLLQRRLTGDQPTLLRDLHRLTGQFPRIFDEFILNHLDDTALRPGPDLTLYLKALENRCRSAGQLADYLKLRDYWTDTQRTAFANSLHANPAIGSMSHPLFYTQVMQLEGRMADLFAWVKTLDWVTNRYITDILKIVAPAYPTECMDIARERATSQLASGQRGRTLYQAIVSWLTTLNTIESLKPPVAAFADHLYKTYPRLSSLREELRMNKLAR